MKKPNFFIIGAPKCGTTSLAAWLAQHPQVFIPSIKEPMYFNTDFGERLTPNLYEYEQLFCDVKEVHKAIGEASTFYLNSKNAVKEILNYSPDAKFIVMLRNPVDMVVSLHAQVCKGLENEYDFRTAWELQSPRSKGFNLPPFSNYPELYQYGERCKLGAQLENLYRNVSKERVLVVFLEDLKGDVFSVYEKILHFLGVDLIFPKSFDVRNKRVKIRSAQLKYFLNMLSYLKRKVGVKASTGFFVKINELNKVEELDEMPDETSTLLSLYFKEDTALIEKLVGRVPSSWYQNWS